MIWGTAQRYYLQLLEKFAFASVFHGKVQQDVRQMGAAAPQTLSITPGKEEPQSGEISVFHQHRAFVYISKSQLKTTVISLPFQWIPVFINNVINHRFILLFHSVLPVFIIVCTYFIACLHLSRNLWIWKNFLFTATHETFWNLRRFISNFHNIYVIHPLKPMYNSRQPHKIQYSRATLLKSSTGPQNSTVCMK